MNMKKTTGVFLVLLASLFVLLFAGCDLENRIINARNTDTVWVFLTLRYEENDGYEFNYYYGEMDKKLYDKVANNLITKGFFRFNNVRYWNNDDLLDVYEDDVYSGNMVFRIEDIRKLNEVKADPILLKQDAELSAAAIAQRDRIQTEGE